MDLPNAGTGYSNEPYSNAPKINTTPTPFFRHEPDLGYQNDPVEENTKFEPEDDPVLDLKIFIENVPPGTTVNEVSNLIIEQVKTKLFTCEKIAEISNTCEVLVHDVEIGSQICLKLNGFIFKDRTLRVRKVEKPQKIRSLFSPSNLFTQIPEACYDNPPKTFQGEFSIPEQEYQNGGGKQMQFNSNQNSPLQNSIPRPKQRSIFSPVSNQIEIRDLKKNIEKLTQKKRNLETKDSVEFEKRLNQFEELKKEKELLFEIHRENTERFLRKIAEEKKDQETYLHIIQNLETSIQDLAQPRKQHLDSQIERLETEIKEIREKHKQQISQLQSNYQKEMAIMKKINEEHTKKKQSVDELKSKLLEEQTAAENERTTFQKLMKEKTQLTRKQRQKIRKLKELLSEAKVTMSTLKEGSLTLDQESEKLLQLIKNEQSKVVQIKKQNADLISQNATTEGLVQELRNELNLIQEEESQDDHEVMFEDDLEAPLSVPSPKKKEKKSEPKRTQNVVGLTNPVPVVVGMTNAIQSKKETTPERKDVIKVKTGDLKKEEVKREEQPIVKESKKEDPKKEEPKKEEPKREEVKKEAQPLPLKDEDSKGKKPAVVDPPKKDKEEPKEFKKEELKREENKDEPKKEIKLVPVVANANINTNEKNVSFQSSTVSSMVHNSPKKIRRNSQNSSPSTLVQPTSIQASLHVVPNDLEEKDRPLQRKNSGKNEKPKLSPSTSTTRTVLSKRIEDRPFSSLFSLVQNCRTYHVWIIFLLLMSGVLAFIAI